MNDIVNSVKDHPSIEHSYKSRLWCSKDDGRKKKRKPKEGKNIEHHDHACMSRFKCKSQLIISCGGQDLRTIKVQLNHHDNHITYYDVALPPGASQIIRENLEWSTPVSLYPRVQAIYPHITGKKIHTVDSDE